MNRQHGMTQANRGVASIPPQSVELEPPKEAVVPLQNTYKQHQLNVRNLAEGSLPPQDTSNPKILPVINSPTEITKPAALQLPDASTNPQNERSRSSSKDSGKSSNASHKRGSNGQNPEFSSPGQVPVHEKRQSLPPTHNGMHATAVTFAHTTPDGTVAKTMTKAPGKNPPGPVQAVEVTYEKSPGSGQGIQRKPGEHAVMPRFILPSKSRIFGLVLIKGQRDTNTLPVGASRTAHIVDYNEAVKWQEAAPRHPVMTESLFLTEALQQHNFYRKKHNADPLVLDSVLCEVAQCWANKLCAWGQKTHSANGYGECIYWKGSGFISGYEPVDYWYREARNFDWTKMDIQDATHHFTQVIWKSTKKLGIAMAVGGFGIYVVANYYPPGNMVGKYAENVSPAPKSENEEIFAAVNFRRRPKLVPVSAVEQGQEPDNSQRVTNVLRQNIE